MIAGEFSFSPPEARRKLPAVLHSVTRLAVKVVAKGSGEHFPPWGCFPVYVDIMAAHAQRIAPTFSNGELVIIPAVKILVIRVKLPNAWMTAVASWLPAQRQVDE